MSKTKKHILRLLALALAVLMPVITASLSFASAEDAGSGQTKQSKYEKMDINALTGHGAEPEDMSVTAGATYQEKAWYEYVTYSDHAVSSYRIDDDHRLLFYDPYTYTDSMIMDVQFDASTTEFDTMSSYTISHTISKSIDACISSTDTSTNAIQTSGRDKSGSTITNTGDTKTIYNHSIDTPTYGTVVETVKKDWKEYRYETTAEQDTSQTSGGGKADNLGNTLLRSVGGFLSGGVAGALSGAVGGLLTNPLSFSAETSTSHSKTVTDNASIVLDKETKTTTYSPDYKTSTVFVGDDTVEYNTESVTEGWSELSARVTKTIGSSTTTSNSWSESESTTVSKTYAATHFASDGVTPLPWAIVHYSVQMPMKCCLQIKDSGEWITISTVYSLLTTVQGTCRAWMQNGQTYYEDWGSGEPVVSTDFWGQFMTKEMLFETYKDKLYPAGGEN